jgi:hypothetical protein
MKRWGWRRPSPALVIACLALFVALGGTVLAATKIDGRTIRVKSLPGNRLAVGSVPGNRLRPGTIPGSRLAPGSVKGDQIDIETLGQVPSATHADAADTARRSQTAIAADHATDASTVNGRAVGCGAGQREFAGACWGSTASTTAVTVVEASIACAAANGELPDALAFLAFARQPGVTIGVGGEWSKDLAGTGPSPNFTMAYLSEGGGLEGASSTLQKRFRCVTPLLN